MRDDGAKEPWAHICHCAHQQAAGRTALGRHAPGIAVARGRQVLHAGDEIRERVALDEHFAGVVPRLAQIAAAANVRVSHHHAAIEQAEAVRS